MKAMINFNPEDIVIDDYYKEFQIIDIIGDKVIFKSLIKKEIKVLHIDIFDLCFKKRTNDKETK